MKRILAVLFVAFSVFGLDDFAVPYTWDVGDTIRDSDFEANNDTIEAWAARTNDSIEAKFLRTSAMDDSTWAKITVDSLTVNEGFSLTNGIDSLYLQDLIVHERASGVINNRLTMFYVSLADSQSVNLSDSIYKGAGQTATTHGILLLNADSSDGLRSKGAIVHLATALPVSLASNPAGIISASSSTDSTTDDKICIYGTGVSSTPFRLRNMLGGTFNFSIFYFGLAR